MGKGYNLYNLEPQFREFLIAENISPISLKNYLSDIRYFLGWMSLKSLKVEDLDQKVVEEYRQYLLDNNLPHKTVNRRLSTLRKFCSFCISQGWMKENPAKKIGNVTKTPPITPPVIEEIKASESPNKIKAIFNKIAFKFKKEDKTEVKPEADKAEVKINQPGSGFSFGLQHYIGFLILLVFVAILGAGIYNQFFSKTTATLAYPTQLTRAGRILSFQGRLTDSLGNPITTATNVTFSLYNVSSGGSPIYTAGACSLTPDQDGIINVLVGGSGYSPTPPTSTYNAVCGSEIDASIFTENANVYMGVTVASDAEMTPRQQIANVGYALNAETLQGFPPGTGTSNIPFIDYQGNMLIATANPDIASTYASATFTISSANATTIQSAGSGDITLQATQSGAISLRTGGATSAETRLYVDAAANGGNVGIGTTAPASTAILDLTSTTKGFVAPRMTELQRDAIVSPATGLMIYNTTTNQYNVYNGTTWGAVGGGGGSSVWSDLTAPTANLLLNMGTYTTEFNYDTGTGANNLFSFTTDASSNGTGYLLNLATGTSSTVKPFHVSSAGTEAIEVNASGNVGIGLSPSAKLDVSGNIGLTQNNFIGYPNSQAQAYTPYNTNYNSLIDSTKGVYVNLDSDNNDADTTAFVVGKNKTDDAATGELFRVGENGNVGIGDSSPASLFTVGSGDLFRIDSSGRIMTIDGVGHAIDDVGGNLTLTSASTQITLNDNTSITGTLTLPNTNTLTGVSGYTQFSNGISVGGGTTYYFNSTGDINSNSLATGGTTRINSGGNLVNIGSTQFNGVTYNWPGADGANGAVLRTNGTGGLSWYDLSGDPDLGPWTIANGSIYPDNSTLDLFIGGTASDSAKFAFLNVNSGDPTASISGNLAITSPAGSNAANSFDILDGGSLNFRTSVGGNAGLTSRLYITNNGYLGIGTTTPSEKLSIQQDDVADLLGLRDGANNTSLLLADGGEATFRPTAFDYVFSFDGVSTYTNNTTEAKSSAGTAFTILAAENPSDDHFYMGLDHKFSTIYLDLDTAGAGATLVTEYFNGSGWSVVSTTDNTTNLTVDGTVTFTPPSDWTTTTVNSQTKYWIRFISTTQVTTAPTAFSASPTTGDRFSVFAQGGDSTNPSLYVNDIGNVGIGTNAPSTKLSIGGSTSSISNSSGDITIDAASGNISLNGDNLINFGQALGSLGSDSLPTYSFSGDGNTGFYSPAADTLAFSNGGSEKARITSTGNLGIGTTSPGAKLHVSDASAPELRITGANDNSTPFLSMFEDYTANPGIYGFNVQYDGANNRLEFNSYDGSSTAVERMVIARSTGNVGIGDTSPASTLTVGSGDLFQVAGATGNITTSGDLALNGGDLTSTGALTVTPNAGSNLNIALSTTGDLVVNTSQLYVDTSQANVGIGTATPNSSYKLHVAGAILADEIVDTTSPGTWYINPAGASNIGGNLTMVGDLFMQDGSPLISSNNGGTYNTITIKGSNDTTTPSLCVEGTGTGANCDGKVNAGTIDPPYTINGKKYATYIASMTGVKEETAGTVATSERVDGVGYRKVIDFNRQPDGSDLWLFAKTAKLRENIKDMIVLLTASDNTRTWFNIDRENLKLTIYSSKPTNVSYRLTAPRFDAQKWKNVREDDDPVRGFLLTDQGDVYGQSQAEVQAAAISGNNVVYNGNLETFKNQNGAFTVIGGYADEFIAATSALIARVKAGYIEAQNVVVNNVLVANKIVTETLDVTTANIRNFVVQEKISSPVVETKDLKVTKTAEIAEIKTNEVKPQSEDLTIDLSNSNQPESGKLAQLIIKGLEGKAVTTIDAQGNASFSGQIVADSLSIENNATVSGTLTAGQFETNEASVSGKLIAKEIQSDNLTDLENRLSRTASDSSTLASSVNDIQRLLAEIQNEPSPPPETQTNLSNTTDLSNMTLEELKVTGTANVYNLSVSNSISTGSILIEDNKILGLSWDLNISALSKINFFDGAVTMARNGTITTRGELIAEGGIRTDEIQPVAADNVHIASLAVDNLTVNDKYLEATTSASVIAAADNFELNGLFAPAIETATSSAGIAILPSNSSEVVIYNNNITEDSLVYLTPTSDYPQSGQLTVVKKEVEGKPYFKVSSNTISALPVKFNWLIVK